MAVSSSAAECTTLVVYNEDSAYEEQTEIEGLTMYDIYREPRQQVCAGMAACDGVRRWRAGSGRNERERWKNLIHIAIHSIALPPSNLPTPPQITDKNIIVNRGLRSINSELTCPICLGILHSTMIVMEVHLFLLPALKFLHARTPRRLAQLPHTPVCLPSSQCLHRFCSECIQKCLRVGRKECPSCRIHVPSRRSLRYDTNFDALINKIYPNLEEYEEHEEKMIESFNKNRNLNNAFTQSCRQGIQNQLQHRVLKTRVVHWLRARVCVGSICPRPPLSSTHPPV